MFDPRAGIVMDIASRALSHICLISVIDVGQNIDRGLIQNIMRTSVDNCQDWNSE